MEVLVTTVFIHIGLSKTGTTSIQAAMARNAEQLRRERDVHYLGFAENHWPAALPFVEPGSYRPLENFVLRGRGTREDARRMADAFGREMRHKAGRHETVIISAEQLQTLDRTAAERLRAFVSRFADAIRIVVYVRHPAERLSSLVSQWVGGGHGSLATFRSEDGVTPALETYAQVFGRDNLIVRRFGRQYFASGDLVADFLDALGQPPLAGVVAPVLNESLTRPAVLLADLLSVSTPLVSGRRGSDHYLRRIPGDKFRATRAMAEEAMRVHAPGLAYLAAEFGVRFDPLDLTELPELISREFPEAALAAIAQLLNEQSRTIGDLSLERNRPVHHHLWGRALSLFGRRRPAKVPPAARHS